MKKLKPIKRGVLMKNTSIVQPKPATEMKEGELIDEIEYFRAENAVQKKFDTLLQEKRQRV
jgi:transposase